MEAVVNSRQMPSDWFGPYMGFEHAELLQLGHYPVGFFPKSLHYGRFLAKEGHLSALRNIYRASPAGALPGSPRAPQTWHSGLPEELHPTTWVADRTLARLRAIGDRPFFLWCSFADPHHPFDPPAPWCRALDPRDVRLPHRDVRELDQKPPSHRNFAMGGSPLTRALNTPGATISDRALATLIAAYHGMVAQIDHQVGRILEAVEALGETIVIFTTDHGELLGDHAMLLKGPFHYDGLVRVPLMLRAPGFPAGHRVADPIGHVDLVPTLERLLGMPPSARVQGGDLAPVVRGQASREAVLCENDHRIWFRSHVQTLVTKDYKLNRVVGEAHGELYGRRDDPGERENRWRETALRRELEARLDALLPRWESHREPVTLAPA